MNYYLYDNFLFDDVFFCKDGKLRIVLNEKLEKGKTPLVALEDVQKKLNFNDAEKAIQFITLLKRNARLENKLTLGEFVECLRPFKKELESLLTINVESFLNSIDLPYSDDIDNLSEKDHEIQISNTMILTENYHFEGGERIEWESVIDGEKRFSYHNTGKKVLDGSHHKDEQKNNWSLVSKNNVNKDELLWYGIDQNGFAGMKNLEIKWVKDLFVFVSADSDKIKLKYKVSENNLFYKDSNNTLIKVENEHTSFFDLVKSLFKHSAMVYTRLTPTMIKVMEHFNRKVDEDKIKETTDTYIKEGLKIERVINENKKSFEDIAVKEFDHKDFTEDKKHDNFVTFNDVINIDLK